MPEDIWTIRRMLDWCSDFLGKHGDPNPLLSAQWLVCGATGLERIELYTNYDKPLSVEEKGYLRDAVRRRAAHEPLQYIVGETFFRLIPVKVRPGVLIPRPETEMLAGECIDWIKSRYADGRKAHSMRPLGGEALSSGVEPGGSDKAAIREMASPRPTVVEIGSGSGCVSCSIAYEVPEVRVIATDIDATAIEVTLQNVELLGLQDKVEVLECDMGAAVPTDLFGSVDVVVSNPPYVPTGVCGTLDEEVRAYEPMLALDGGEDGLDVARRLFSFAASALRPGGLLAVELFEGHMDTAAELAREAGFDDVVIIKDLADRPRILRGTRK